MSHLKSEHFLNRAGHQHGPAGAAAIPADDVLKHLGDSLSTQWQRYRKRLKRCQKHFSEEAVHASRVETRRLLATIELLGAFLPEHDLRKARRALKHHLESFGELRDTQVQLVYVGRMAGTFPDAHAFYDWLRDRKARFIRETRKAVKHIQTRRLGRRLAMFEKEIRHQRKEITRERAFIIAQRAMNQAFARVARLCRQVQAGDTRTIHRTRIAFKRFRYMVQALAPLLPAVTPDHRRAMRGYQCMMGDIQDMEVLLAALDKFVQKEGVNARSARRLKKELVRWRRMLIRIYLNAAGRLERFWPPPELRQPKQKRKNQAHEPLSASPRHRC
ncbi:MAG: CHAD domain-containing protein [Verrucomicrobiia bacterium]